MIRYKSLVAIAVFVGSLFGLAVPSPAHYLYMAESTAAHGGSIIHAGEYCYYAAKGQTVWVDVYLHATEADELEMWSVTAGYDDYLISGELEWLTPLNYGETVLRQGYAEASYVQGPGVSSKYPAHSNASIIKDISRMSHPPDWTDEDLTAGEDFLLFSLKFLFNDDSYEFDGEDVWIEWKAGADGFGFDSGYFNTLDVSGKGPDYTLVPIPGAVLLLGSGLMGLLGIRRIATFRDLCIIPTFAQFWSLRGAKRRGNLVAYQCVMRLLRFARNDNIGVLQRSHFSISLNDTAQGGS